MRLMQDNLGTALYWHRSGQYELAAMLYRQILSVSPDNPDALHLLGVLHNERGDHATAITLINQAIALRPESADYYLNLAEAYRALGQGEQAVACCKMAVRLRPDHLAALFNLGTALHGLGRSAEAIESFRRAVQLQPNSVPTHTRLGNLLRQLGRMEEALSHFQRAAALAPNDAGAQSNLGQMLINLNRGAEAVPPCRAAVRLQPDRAPLHLLLGDALRAAERFDEARLSYLRAIELQPTLAQAHANLGMLLRAQKKTLEAFAPLQRAVELEPNNALYWNCLAVLHTEWTSFAAGISCWQRAIELQPGQGGLHLGLSEALREVGRLAEAEEHVRIALRLQPESGAPHYVLGFLQEQLNDKEQAEAAFRTALRVQPSFIAAWDALVRLLRGRVPDADRLAIEKSLADPRLNDEGRIQLLFTLATIHDARGEYSGAAQCAGKAHALSAGRARGRGLEYEPENYRDFIGRMIQAFPPEFFQRTAGGGLPTQRPVFIVGLQRSGTTLIEQILASHPRVHGAGELGLVMQTMVGIPEMLGRTGDPLACVPALEPTSIRRLAEQHLTRLAAWDDGRADRIVDKMPDNYQYLGLLAVLFPRATIIHCRRDPRDVAISCWFNHFGWVRWTHEFRHIATRFEQYERLMAHWQKVLPVTLHEVVYEELVNDLEGTARRLVAACDLDWDPACLEFHRSRRAVRTASSAQVRTPLYQQSIGRWKNYEQELAAFLTQLPCRAPAGTCVP
jgi:tetratricopeptide (TPR) repeat protein